MPLREIQIAPGFNKQVTPTGAAGRWIDGDNVRFRYGFPEKIGGWSQITGNSTIGVARDIHIWTDIRGRRYVAYGTNKGLFLYFDGALYDISPLETAITGATFSSSNGSASVTINKSAHGLAVGDLFTFTSVTLPGGGATGYAVADFTTNTFEVTTVPNNNAFTVTMASNESGTGMSGAGSATINPYVKVGGIGQTAGFGYGVGEWGGTISPLVTTTLNGALLDDEFGTGGSGTTIALTDASQFSSAGKILVGSELITYTSIVGNDLQGIVRGTNGTTRSAHSDGASVQDASNYVSWGESVSSSELTLDPGNWSLDNFGQKLVATIHNDRTFTWSPITLDPNALTTRATVVSTAPTKSSMSIVSERDRHLIHLGTNTSVSDGNTQNLMFIRFSDQEDITDYTPTSTNTAGTFQLDSGSRIIGAAKAKDYILILTDTSAYRMQFVGPPFTFSITQVGSNCGLMAQHAVVYANGACFWMGRSGGFYLYDGTVKKMPCSVEDFVFTTKDSSDLGINLSASDTVYAQFNSLFGEINWFYPKSGSSQIDRSVTYNYLEGVWTTGSLARTIYHDKTVFDNPIAGEFNATGIPTFPTIQGATNTNGATTLYFHETGTDEVDNEGNVTSVIGSIQSGDFELPIDGTLGQIFTTIRRFVPDFRALTGNAQVTINLRDFPNDAEVSSTLGPFTVNSSTKKIDTRSRARAVNFDLRNTTSGETWRFGTFRADIQPDGQR